MIDPAYRRVIVKLSGEALSGVQDFGIDPAMVETLAADLVKAAKLGVELGVVVGGGNIFRGVQVSARGVPRPVGDTMGMLATVMNCLVLEAAIERQGHEARTLSALAMPSVCETYNRKRAREKPRQGPHRTARCRHRQSIFHHRHYGRAARGGTQLRGGAQGDQRGRRLYRRPEEGSESQALRTPQPPGSDRKGPAGDGWRRLRACPREPHAYHRFFDPPGRVRLQPCCAAKAGRLS